MGLRLSKHHGLGNDFLVAFVAALPLDAAQRAIDLCHRREGIGADGLIYGLPADGDAVEMRLLNSDGSPAEISGNGLRCFAQAVARQRGAAHLDLDVRTPAGTRHCSVRATDDPAVVVSTVEMGIVTPGPDPDVADLVATLADLPIDVRRWETAEVGNPHVVIEVDAPESVAVDVVGPAIESHFGGGINVHFGRRSGANEITLRHWERGAGVTNACGSGATVAAAIYRQWGEVGDKVVVHMPGGHALVNVADPITLTGPATHVADIEVPDA